MSGVSKPATNRRWAAAVSVAVVVTGLLHLALGAITFRDPLVAMTRAGVWNSLDGQVDRQATLWYVVGGAFLIVAGLTARWVVRRTGVLPPPLGWGLVVVAVLGVVVAPRSGFGLVLIEGLLLAILAHRLSAPPRSTP